MSKERIDAVTPIQETIVPKKVRCYNIDEIVMKNTDNKYCIAGDPILIIIEGTDGVIVSNTDGVHSIFPDSDAELTLQLADYKEGEFPLMGQYPLKIKIQELMDFPYEEKELGQAIRRFGSRIENNYRILLEGIIAIGLSPEDYPRGDMERTSKGKQRIDHIH